MHIRAEVRLGRRPCTIVGFIEKFDRLYVVVVFEDGSINNFPQSEVIVTDPTIAPKNTRI